MNLLNSPNRLFSIFSKGKSLLSLSALVTESTPLALDNIYFHESYPISTQITPKSIFRLIISPQISSKDMNININQLKLNPIMNQLIQAQSQKIYDLKASRIIIDSFITPNQQEQDPYKNIKDNMLQIQKMLTDGLGIRIAYMISSKNYNAEWLKLLSKKIKAIDANIILNGINFSETVYNEGYNLQHIFLRSYTTNINNQIDQNQQLALNTKYNLKEFASVLATIRFNGKIILRAGPNFQENAIILEKALKDVGYTKQSSMRQQQTNWYNVL